MRGEVSAIGGVRSGSRRGATSHRKISATPPTNVTGSTHSNNENSCIPRSREIPTTNRLVDVPIVVDIPPMMVARPIGSITPDTGNFARSEAPTRIGMSNTTIGVLFMKALRIAPAISVVNKATAGCFDQALLTTLASGCRAPVVSSALPTIISAQIAINASLPKPAKKSTGANNISPLRSYGNNVKPATSKIKIVSDDDSSGIRSRVNKNNAMTVRTSTAMPCASIVVAIKRTPFPS